MKKFRESRNIAKSGFFSRLNRANPATDTLHTMQRAQFTAIDSITRNLFVSAILHKNARFGARFNSLHKITARLS